ncbi:hypothetical protein GCM10008956_01850 [Deinococcus arenae]|uniref:Uncharacterized protein n=1 Tax=Deinococcus arenae TaxID=1452751 RepID=A0A8H9GID9_9DEIO|nr:hypothetical protein [Deinococcus arenae]GGM29513.1 hypothetical protein GCM10008956_01850 [Deinococcus arenae]
MKAGLTCAALGVTGLCMAGGAGVTLPAPPAGPPAQVGGLRVCERGDTTYLLDRSGRVRSLTYARLVPDNRLLVRQSYDRAGRLTGLSVQWSGFAGRLLDVRGSFDARGRLVRETGFRARGVTTPLRSYLRAVPKGVTC